MANRLKAVGAWIVVSLTLLVAFYLPIAGLMRGQISFGRRSYAVDLTPGADGPRFYFAAFVMLFMAFSLLACVVVGVRAKHRRQNR